MGVTIHFEGSLKSEQAFKDLLEISLKFSKDNGFESSTFYEEDKLLERVRDEADWDYQGPAKGIIIQVSENCDPINLEFDENLYIQEYCKTQYVPPQIHVLICDFLRMIEPFFSDVKVYDEAEYWDTKDPSLLEKHLEQTFEAIDLAKKDNSSLSGPYRVEGRIVDLM